MLRKGGIHASDVAKPQFNKALFRQDSCVLYSFYEVIGILSLVFNV